MRFLAMAFGLGLSLAASQVHAQSDQVRTERIKLSECFVFSPFDSNLIVRIPSNPYDVITYNLAFKLREEMLLVAFDPWGNRTYERTYATETNNVKKFSILENQGNEAKLTKDIQIYLKQNELFTCKIGS